jgi:hypothetical protein
LLNIKVLLQALTIDWQYGSVEMKNKPKVPPTPPYIGEKDELLQPFSFKSNNYYNSFILNQ